MTNIGSGWIRSEEGRAFEQSRRSETGRSFMNGVGSRGRRWSGCWRSSLLWGIVFTASCLFWTGSIQGQRGTAIPSPSHFDTYPMIYRGNFTSAIKHSQAELSGATRVGSLRWIDSICYYALLGEVYFIQGDLDAALENYESAIDIYLNNRDWLSRVLYPTGITTTPPPAVPWGRGNRNVPIGVFPRDAMIRIGDPITEERLRQGGMMSNPEMRKIAPDEILRCVTLALRRRNEILGPLARFDARCQPILECFSTRTVPPNHWSVVLLDVLYGIALEGAGKYEDAVNLLCKSLLMSGESDHFLTASALLTLGDIYLETGKTFEAADSYYEASVSAFAYGDILLIEEALRKFSGACRAQETKPGTFSYREGIQWADQAKSPFLSLSLSLGAAEVMIEGGDDQGAENALRTASGLIGKMGLDQSRYADLFHYLNGVLFFRKGRVSDGEESFTSSIDGVTRHSPRFFQIDQLNSIVGELTPRAGTDLYETLLRRPDFVDWAEDAPLALAIEVSGFQREFANLFLILIDRDLKDRAFNVAEYLRTRRFLSATAMGGRLFSFRYLMETPIGNLSNESRVLRQNILQDYPDYADLSKQAEDVKRRLKELPLVPDDSSRGETRRLLDELDEVSVEQETVLKRIAASRIPSPELFPPLISSERIQTLLPEGTAILSFLEVEREIYAFLITKDILDAWRVGSVGGVTGSLASFLRSFGVVDANKAKMPKDLFQEDWKEEGSRLLTGLLGNPSSSDPRSSVPFTRLIVVPDSVLWYCPFEALSLPSGEGYVSLIASPGLTVGYAPTATLAFSGGGANKDLQRETAIVPGPLFPKETEGRQSEAIGRLDGILRKPVLLKPDAMGAPSALYAFKLDRLLVLHEIDSSEANWGPIGYDVRPKGNQISTWSSLPWGGPRQAIFAGFRSPAETALKDGGNGAEFFFPLMILEAQGAESVLISRWRPGGLSTYRLIESFLENLEEKEPLDAWKDAVTQLTQTPLDLREEPRFKGQIPKPAPFGESPFFWAEFMTVDRGIEPDWPDEEGNGNALNGGKPPLEGPEESPETEEGMEMASGHPEDEDDVSGSLTEEENGPSPVVTGHGEEESGITEKESDGVTSDAHSDPTKTKEKEKKGESKSKRGKGRKGDEVKEADESDRKPSKPETSTSTSEGNNPITDEDLEEEDRNADDFYAPGK